MKISISKIFSVAKGALEIRFFEPEMQIQVPPTAKLTVAYSSNAHCYFLTLHSCHFSISNTILYAGVNFIHFMRPLALNGASKLNFRLTWQSISEPEVTKNAPLGISSWVTNPNNRHVRRKKGLLGCGNDSWTYANWLIDWLSLGAFVAVSKVRRGVGCMACAKDEYKENISKFKFS